MSYYDKKNVNITTPTPLSNLARGPEVSDYINRQIAASQYNFHQTEAFEVDKVILNELGKRGSISGKFLNSGVELEDVKPLFGNLTVAPLRENTYQL